MISVAIMAHPKRAKWIPSLVKAIDADVTVVWDRRNDRWDTGRRALLAYDPAATHHAVIQDDAVVCRDLVAGLERMVEHTGHHPLGLYFGANAPYMVTNRLIAGVATDDGYRWVKMKGPVWGVGMCLPTGDIDRLVEAADQKAAVKNYDTRILRWYQSKGIDCFYPWPSIVDHRRSGENPSLVPGRTADRYAFSFLGTDKSAAEMDWGGPVLDPDKVTLKSKGIGMFTFRNLSTGQVVNLEPDDTRVNRLSRMTHRWERIDEGEPAPAGIANDVDMTAKVATILEAVGSDVAKAQAVMEAEATAEKPRSTLMQGLAEIIAGSEEE